MRTESCLSQTSPENNVVSFRRQVRKYLNFYNNTGVSSAKLNHFNRRSTFCQRITPLVQHREQTYTEFLNSVAFCSLVSKNATLLLMEFANFQPTPYHFPSDESKCILPPVGSCLYSSLKIVGFQPLFS